MNHPLNVGSGSWSPKKFVERLTGRNRSITLAASSAFLTKGITVLVSAVTVPITVRYLGGATYGLWITISSAIAMFLVLDIGISTTLTNLISEAYAKEDRPLAAQYLSTAFWSLIVIAGVLGVVAAVVWHWVQWDYLFHIQGQALTRDTSRAVAAAFAVFLVSLPVSLVTRVLAGYQQVHVANLFSAGGSILSLIAVVIVVQVRGGLPLLVGAYAGSAVLANLICFLWLCIFSKPWMKPLPAQVRLHHFSRVFGSGAQFFAIQIAGLVVFSSDNLIISHYLSPLQVTPYSVTWRLVNYIAVAQTFLFPAMWPAYSEAYARGHIDWIRRAYRHVRSITIVVLAVGCSVLILFGRAIIHVWAGPSAVPSESLICLMCVWIVIYAFTANQSCLMGATFRTGKQAVIGIVAAAANLILSIVWVKPMGISGVLLATIVSYVVFIVAVQSYEVLRILRGDFLLQENPQASSGT